MRRVVDDLPIDTIVPTDEVDNHKSKVQDVNKDKRANKKSSLAERIHTSSYR